MRRGMQEAGEISPALFAWGQSIVGGCVLRSCWCRGLDQLEAEGMKVNEPSKAFATELGKLMRDEVYPQFYQDIGGGDAKKGEQIIQQIIDLGN